MKKLLLLVCVICSSYNAKAQCDSTLPVSENFSNPTTVNACWDFIDADGDGHNWYIADITGNNGLISESFTFSTGYLTPDNWAITYAIDLTSYSTSSNIQLTWKVRASSWSFDKERYTVYAASGNKISDFTSSSLNVFEDLDNSDASGAWGSRSLNLSPLAGKIIYIAFRHHLSVGQREIEIDDIQISSGSSGGCTDSDGDSICDSLDQCPGFDDRIDTDGDGIPDGCETSSCNSKTANFSNNPLTHSGSGSQFKTLTLPTGSQNISFTLSNLNEKLKGKQSDYYIERVQVTYKDAVGITKTNGTYRGDQISSATINIPNNAQSITISLDDAYDGNAGSAMSVNLSPVTYCSTSGTNPNPCTDSSGNFSKNPLTHTGSGSNSTTSTLPINSQDASFTISGLDTKTKGKAGSLYIETVVVSYVDGLGVSKTYGTYNGSNVSSASINILGIVKSITISLSNFSGSTSSTMSVNLSTIAFCVSSSSSSTANSSTKELNSQQVDSSEPLDTTFKIYPNPASSKLFVKSSDLYDSKGKMNLYNMNGIQVRSYDLNSKFNQTNELDINGLATGLYVLHILSENGNVLKTERIIIK